MTENNQDIEHTQSYYGVRAEAEEFPMMCVLSFVYICNARCPNCPYTNSNIRLTYKDTPIMSGETFKIIADQCGQYKAWLRISGGGEPMLHAKAVELFEYAKKVGAKVGLITNGSLFNEENSTRLLNAGIDMIEFSVDAGDPATYSRVRKGLDWDKLVVNVKRMRKLRDRLKSPTKIIASIINQVGVDVDKAISFWSRYVDNLQKRKYLTWNISDPGESADPHPYLEPEEHIPCPFLFERLNIDSRGKVMVCGFDIRATTDMGNVHEKQIKDIWHSEGFNYFRKMHLNKQGHKLELCKNCPDWKYRSWKHNYWKLVKSAELSKKRFFNLDIQDIEGNFAED